MVAPLAPHLAEELWQRLGHETSLAHGPFPVADPQYLVEDTVEYPVQVNGKVRGHITVPPTPTPTPWKPPRWPTRRCRPSSTAPRPKKVIVVAGRLVNLVV